MTALEALTCVLELAEDNAISEEEVNQDAPILEPLRKHQQEAISIVRGICTDFRSIIGAMVSYKTAGRY